MPAEGKKASFAFPADFLTRLMDLSAKNEWLTQKRKCVEDLFQVCGDADEARVILHTLEVFQYVDGNKLSVALESISKQVNEIWCLSPTDTCVVCKDIEGKTDSSAAMQQMIKPYFSSYEGWSSNRNFLPNIEKVLEKKTIKNIVIVDDFSGTGKSLEKLCVWVTRKCNELGRNPVNIYAAFVAAMDETINRKYPKILADMYYNIGSKKAISQHFKNDGASEKDIMISIENRFGGIRKSYSLGFDKSEAAFYLQNFNTPNNVLPIFWHKGKSKSAMFPRMAKNNEK
jgi:hypothetical protein